MGDEAGSRFFRLFSRRWRGDKATHRLLSFDWRACSGVLAEDGAFPEHRTFTLPSPSNLQVVLRTSSVKFHQRYPGLSLLLPLFPCWQVEGKQDGALPLSLLNSSHAPASPQESHAPASVVLEVSFITTLDAGCHPGRQAAQAHSWPGLCR